jgi:hypothetical protein
VSGGPISASSVLFRTLNDVTLRLDDVIVNLTVLISAGDANYYQRPVPVATSTGFDSLSEKYRLRWSLATDNDDKPFSAYEVIK